MAENVAFVVRLAAERLRAQALWPWHFTMADSWQRCADDMELRGAREVPFIGRQGVEPGAMIVIDGAGIGNPLWTSIVNAARAYLGEEPHGPD